MGEPSERELRKRRAEQLRSEIDELRRGGGQGSGAASPREFTDEAAAEAFDGEREHTTGDDNAND